MTSQLQSREREKDRRVCKVAKAIDLNMLFLTVARNRSLILRCFSVDWIRIGIS